jgi:anti-sigma B factor antagonist
MIDWKIEGLGEEGQVIVVHLRGELERSHCDYIFEALKYHIEEGHPKVVLNCYDLKFISSLGLGVLMQVHARMKKHGGDVRLARVQSAVAKVIQMVMLDKILKIFPTVREAVASFEAEAE